MFEHLSPVGIPQMPSVFRIAALERTSVSDRQWLMKATLHHAQATMAVSWTVRQPDSRLKVGRLVSPRYCGQSLCADGYLRIARLALIERPDRSVDLFQTVLPAWVPDQTILARGSRIWSTLDLPWQELFNGVLWEPGRFYRFCTGPSSLRGHHSGDNGNLIHSIETSEQVLAMLPQHPAANAQVTLAAALFHDIGKADEYEPGRYGWKMSDDGHLVGHKVRILEWLAQARGQVRCGVPATRMLTLRNALGSARDVRAESGFRTPKTPEARLLSLADQSSGAGDLYARQAAKGGGWGRPHPHLGGEMPYTQPPM
jgi:3'-5' exoribonuclease